MPLALILAAAFIAGLLLAEEVDRIRKGRTVTEEAAALETSAGTAWQSVADFIKRQEGFSAKAYADSGNVAIGYGHDITGTETTLDPDQLLEGDIKTASDAVDSVVNVPLTENQRTALISLVYNIGAGAFASSTLLSMLNAGNYAGAADQFGRWIHSEGVVVPDLVRRRAEERALFLS
jgi:lysozyme